MSNQATVLFRRRKGLLIPVVNGEELPARSCTIRQASTEATIATVEIVLVNGVVFEEDLGKVPWSETL